MTDPAAVTAAFDRKPQTRCVWLFSPAVDLAAFLGSALLALGLLAAGAWLGVLHSHSPEWTWVTAVLLVDVAHVYATGFRVYADRQEFLQRRWLYVLTPVLAFLIGWAIYTEGDAGRIRFWRILAYMAVFHFVRQQYGWVALYRARAGETSTPGRWIDSAAIYLATLYPLVWWHSHLPRNFWWFLEADFAQAPELAAELLEPVYWLALLLYSGRSLYRGMQLRAWNPGKDIVVATTAVCWYVGIITFNSDYAFTVTNVIIHGVPYFVLIYWYRYRTAVTAGQTEVPAGSSGTLSCSSSSPDGARPGTEPQTELRIRTGNTARRIVFFFGTLWLLAFIEELLWDRGVWRERSWLFGSTWFQDPQQSAKLQSVLVPLLAVPQITHYILDGFIWKRRSNSRFHNTVEGITT
ncbi:MAG: hypothetical protein VB858_08520 [Planctomycetaceae bacterium]